MQARNEAPRGKHFLHAEGITTGPPELGKPTLTVSAAARSLIDASKPEYEAPLTELDHLLQEASRAIVTAISHATSVEEVTKVCGKNLALPLPMITGLANRELDRRGRRSDFWDKAKLAAISSALSLAVGLIAGYLLGKR